MHDPTRLPSLRTSVPCPPLNSNTERGSGGDGLAGASFPGAWLSDKGGHTFDDRNSGSHSGTKLRKPWVSPTKILIRRPAYIRQCTIKISKKKVYQNCNFIKKMSSDSNQRRGIEWHRSASQQRHAGNRIYSWKNLAMYLICLSICFSRLWSLAIPWSMPGIIFNGNEARLVFDKITSLSHFPSLSVSFSIHTHTRYLCELSLGLDDRK